MALKRSRLAKGAEVMAERVAQAGPDAVHCDVLIVGSGYGGAVAAARLAGAIKLDGDGKPLTGLDGKPVRASVWVLERGRERLPGSFPSRFGDLPGEVRFSRQDGTRVRGHLEGVFDVHLGDDVHVMVGNGLGGGSLINAGVMARPLDEVFEFEDADGRRCWPQALDAERLGSDYERAEQMLGVGRLPESETVAPPPKLVKLRELAQAKRIKDDGNGFRCPIAVSFDETPSVAGVQMGTCTRCGDCMTGCNQGAKHTLDTNYLAWARRRGAELFCGGWVQYLERSVDDGGHWRVHWRFTAAGKGGPGDGAFVLRARRVILAAGSLGSTAILLRSQRHGLRLSAELGRRFSTNGNQFAAAFRQPGEPTFVARDEDEDPGGGPYAVGPTITGMLHHAAAGSPIAVEEFAVPAPLRGVFGEIATTFGVFHSLLNGTLEPHPADDGCDPLAVTPASLDHTLFVGMMGDDGAEGRIELASAVGREPHDGDIRIRWSLDGDSRAAKLFDAETSWMQSACEGRDEAPGPGGTVIPNPIWRMLPSGLDGLVGGYRGAAVTMHPLGGCPMADDVGHGVVDDAGRVFDTEGRPPHPGLAVLDGSIVPCALCVNPALTIAAIAERAAPLLAVDWGLKTQDAPLGELEPGDELAAGWHVATGTTAVRISEQMTGFVELNGRRWFAELEVPSLPIPDLPRCLRSKDRELPFDPAHPPQLRLYPSRAHAERRADGVSARLSGHLTLFKAQPLADRELERAQLGAIRILLERVRSRPTNGALADALAASENRTDTALGVAAEWAMKVLGSLADHRTIEYALTVEAPGRTGLRRGDRLLGTKSLAFAETGNPWRQLMTLELEWQRAGQAEPMGRLEADLGYFAKWRQLLAGISAQRDQPTALLDMAGFALLALRVLMVSQWPHFVPPGDMPPAIDGRRPGPLEGLDFEPPTAVPGTEGAKLTRYWMTAAIDRGLLPLVLIHGLSAAGSTFAHPSIPGNLVREMARRGRDVWVLDLSSSSANDPATLGSGQAPGFEEVAQTDIPAAVCCVLQATGADKVDVVAHCIGAAMFTMAVLRSGDRPKTTDRPLGALIGCAVLSQVGPQVQLSPFNRMRGFAAGFLQQFLEVETIDVRGDHEKVNGAWRPKPEREPSALAIDVLLASFPYPDDDFEAARAARIDAVPDESRDFRRLRHRVDAIVGQTFQLDNLADDTLLALDAIFGWVKSRMLAQVLYLAREGLLTDVDGHNRSITGRRIGERMQFPVLLLHGRENRVFDWQGSHRSWQTLSGLFVPRGAARADPGTGGAPRGRSPDECPPDAIDEHGDWVFGAGTTRQLRVLRGYGHQDCFIGRNAQHDVFPHIDAFLREQHGVGRGRPIDAGRKFDCGWPWKGPMLGWTRAVAGQPDVVDFSLLVDPGPRRADTVGVVLVPYERRGGKWVRLAGVPPIAHRLGGATEDLRDRLRREAVVFRLPLGSLAACAVLMLRRRLDDKGPTVADPPGQFALDTDETREERAAVEAFLKRPEDDDDRLEMFVVELGRAQQDARDRSPLGAAAIATRPALDFVLGSCQFPPGLSDKEVAGDAFRHLDREIDADPEAAPGFALLLGDQVYLDSMANVFISPVDSPESIAARAYELNWRLRPLRRVTRRLPTYFMLDDHEVDDNWQPGTGRPGREREQAAIRAFMEHQGKLNPRDAGTGAGGSFAYAFAPAGVPFHVLDTRTQRDRRAVGGAAGVPLERARIVPDEDMRALLAWLERDDVRAAPLKFIASPSIVLPLDRNEARMAEEAERLGLDSWSGYPASLVELLRFIDDQGIAGVVFLCGDAHLSAVAEFTFDSGRRVHAVVSSGLYAPWPFANSRAQDLLKYGPVDIACAGRRVSGCLRLVQCTDGRGLAMSTANGYARLRVATSTAGPVTLSVSLVAVAPGQATKTCVIEF